jgi:hypothetical protein
MAANSTIVPFKDALDDFHESSWRAVYICRRVEEEGEEGEKKGTIE